ncbi:MAG TPA: T9SS type A sorting domain-containing protein, partial [Ignavibacteria bacterium]|nr:T9SS type A sorting domain-containing protein [Ignavibacteria bacterium]
SIIKNQYVFVVEDVGRVYKSSNFGDTWDSIGYVTGSDQPYVCRFSSLTTGWVGGTFGQLFKSIDSGATWRRENTGIDQRYFGALWFFNDSIGWGVGGNTKIVYTTTSGLTNLNDINNIFPEDHKLYQNYPNPFNPETKIKFEITKPSLVQIKVYDNIGREISILVNENLKSGVYETAFNGINYTSGVYFYSLYANGILVDTKKLFLVK